MAQFSETKDFTRCLILFALVIFSTNHCCNSFCLPDTDVSSSSTAQDLTKLEGSARLCPEGSAFHNGTSSCQKILEKGPCGDLQLFYALSKESEYGACGCMSNEDGCNQIVKSNRMILPGPDGNHCFWAYSSGPCPDGQWYVLNMKSLQPECQKNECFPANASQKPHHLVGTDEIVSGFGNDETDKFTFALNNTCFDTYTQAYCPEGQYVQFLGTNSPYPKCVDVKKGPPFCIVSVAPVVGMPCQAGYKHVGDDCVPANIDFE